jgi:hypothetical protein
MNFRSLHCTKDNLCKKRAFAKKKLNAPGAQESRQYANTTIAAWQNHDEQY